MSEKYGADGPIMELIVGDGGVFEVEADGTLVYSKKATGAFPRYGEIPMALDLKRLQDEAE